MPRSPVTSALARSIEVPRSAVTFPAAYVRPPENVVVATPIHVVPTRASIVPGVPAKSEEVEIDVASAVEPVMLPRIEFAAT